MAEEHPKEVSGNNNSPDPIEEDLSESHNSHKILDDTLVDRASTGEKGGMGMMMMVRRRVISGPEGVPSSLEIKSMKVPTKL